VIRTTITQSSHRLVLGCFYIVFIYQLVYSFSLSFCLCSFSVFKVWFVGLFFELFSDKLMIIVEKVVVVALLKKLMYG